MDKIQAQLIKPFVEKMEREWQALYDQVRTSPAPEAQELCPVVEGQLGKVRDLLEQENLENSPAPSDSQGMHDFLRQSKLDFRNAQRKWQRHIVSTERAKTRQMNQSEKFSLRPRDENV